MIGVKCNVGHEIRKVVKRIGYEIKENTELAEHETGINNAKSNEHIGDASKSDVSPNTPRADEANI